LGRMTATRASVNGNAPAAAPSLLLFGPQFPRLSQTYLSDLRAFIIGNPDLGFLVDTITELPSLWPTLQQAHPSLSRIPGEEKLDQLSQYIKSGTLPNVKSRSNILLAPLTVISQIVEFWRLGRETENAAFPASFQSNSKLGSVQGFCIGFLTSSAVACSQNRAQFQQFSSTALRLAVCVGAIVDLDEGSLLDPLDRTSSFAVRWKTDSEQASLEKTLKTYSRVSFSG
jgi:Starter unit:ACP transacylase in aflatoxin biosynthesis